ncbi:hypothetical protein SDC9_174488 [bioreactor metagenome]|uniref:Uncharacterized protein n=1 Tax=bioreactor metagenome TaxID=1076179 RepID=A0A645GJB4_9ZZZZ
MCNTVLLDDFNGGGLVVLKINIAVPIGVEGDELLGRVQQVGTGDGFFSYLVDDGQQVLQLHSSVRTGLDLRDGAAVGGLHGEHCIRHRSTGVCI